MKRVGVVLSGCGVFDGSEIHEAVLTLLALSRIGAQAVCLAPDREQMQVIDHLHREPVAERRNVLVEAARIARGDVTSLAQADASQLDALIVPGGFGAAKISVALRRMARSAASIRRCSARSRVCIATESRWGSCALRRRCCPCCWAFRCG